MKSKIGCNSSEIKWRQKTNSFLIYLKSFFCLFVRKLKIKKSMKITKAERRQRNSTLERNGRKSYRLIWHLIDSDARTSKKRKRIKKHTKSNIKYPPKRQYMKKLLLKN
jgi:hypothetical protein